MNLSPLIEAEELQSILQNPEVLIFDVSNGPNAEENYRTKHIKGAVWIDLNAQLSDIKQDFALGGRHPLPAVDQFARTLESLGITPEKHLILYDDANGANASARFWWMLKAVGHKKVQVLNGGSKSAEKAGLLNSTDVPIVQPADQPYPVSEWKLPLVDLTEVQRVSEKQDYQVIDVRSKERYDGITEPIDLIAGHIPGAINVPLTENLDELGRFLSPEVLKEKYLQLRGDIPAEKVIVHCGSGVTACHTILAMNYAGLEIPNLYVGSWSEWSRNELPIATNV